MIERSVVRSFGRDQQLIAFLIGLIIVMIYFVRPLSSPLSFSQDNRVAGKSDQIHGVFIEVKGLVKRPGVYSFDKDPSCVEVIQKGNGIVEGLVLKTCDRTPILESGDRLTVVKKDEGEAGIQIADMDAASQLVLGIPLDINDVDSAKLDTLPGVDRHLAERIVRFREEHGPVRSLDDLLKVCGIGKKKLEKLRPYLIIR
ncbi:MAG: helix-hairpin-helix domain-containing protein [Pseudomonadota bacterium]